MADHPILPKRPFLILRHGETDWNVVQRMQGARDIPLNATGRRQAASAAAIVATSGAQRVLSSPLSRASETAKAAAAVLNAPLSHDARLVERSFGALEGMTVAEVKDEYGYGDGVNFHLIDGPEIEDASAVITRTGDAISEYLEKSEDLALIVAHGQIFSMFVNALLGDYIIFANAKPYMVEPDANGWKISCFDAA